jgi:ribose transport system permease protein
MTNLASAGGSAHPDSPNVPSTVERPGATAAAHGSDHRGEAPSGRQYRALRVTLGVIRLGPVLILAGLIVAMTLLSPVFLTTGNIGNVLAQTAAIAVLAVGQLLVILTRGVDLSVGSNLALASVLGAIAFEHGATGVMVIVVMLAAGAAVGVVNGAVYVFGRLPHPFIITLATLSLARGLALQL